MFEEREKAIGHPAQYLETQRVVFVWIWCVRGSKLRQDLCGIVYEVAGGTALNSREAAVSFGNPTLSKQRGVG